MGTTSAPEQSGDGGSKWKVGIPLILLVVVGFVVAFQFVGPPPPKELTLATGSEGGAYHQFGELYRVQLAASGIDLRLLPTAGSIENIAHLRDGSADIAFVQGGTVDEPANDANDGSDDSRVLEGIGSLYFEPLWVFHRAELELEILADLAGLRIQIGGLGSGTNVLSRTLLKACGVTEANSTLQELDPDAATAALLAGGLDALLVVSGPKGDTVQTLMAQEGLALTLLDVDRSHSVTQVFRSLSPVLLSEGLLNLDLNVPDRDVQLVAPTASLIATEDLHPALVPLFISAAEKLHGKGALFEDEGQFPSAMGLDVEPSVAAATYYKSGPSFLYRIFPFGTAAMLDRLKIMLLPLLTLLLPLMKVAPPLYRWSIRSKIYRWYKVLHQVDSGVHRAAASADLSPFEAELARVEKEIVEVKVPPSYGEEAYNLRMHLALTRKRLAERKAASEHAES